jgi:hypothetical protein
VTSAVTRGVRTVMVAVPAPLALKKALITLLVRPSLRT